MNIIPIQIDDKSNGHNAPMLKQTIQIIGYVPQRKERNKMTIEYLKSQIQPGINWTKEQAKKMQESKSSINYKIAGLNLTTN